jgi:predicted Zn-dependent protease
MTPPPSYFKPLILLLITLCIPSACAPTRPPLPAGTIPTQKSVPLKEEQYGQQVFRQLAEQFPLDRDDNRIGRARRIVDRLTTVRGNDQNIWHVYVFRDDTLHNAGATRGNYIFVWSALLDAVADDAELSAIFAHEIGHVLAGHTQPDPTLEAKQMIAGLSGTAARNIMIHAGSGSLYGLAGLGGMLASELVKAVIVNPDQQALELEADQLGLFLMAEAGYDPRKAVEFWTKAQHDPRFKSGALTFLSSHPSTETRREHLEKLLPEALARYRGTQSHSATSPNELLAQGEKWIAVEKDVPLHEKPNESSTEIGEVPRGSTVGVKQRLRRWLSLSPPYEGFVESRFFAPKNP